ncbi:MAG TPA: NUDIX hydrolase [Patescibacteria group bacterium]|nr:NUDIX hydrolase [Patescibacteria group bacterium]
MEKIYQNNLTYYKCRACHQVSERSLVIDNKIIWRVDDQKNYWHESVGIVVVDKDNKILCMLRKIFPFSYSIPAGHLDKGEGPENAALRELKEETGIKTDHKLELLGEFNLLKDSCRRGSDHHQWHLYKLKVINQDTVKLSDESSTVGWYDLDELKKMDNLTYPLAFIINKFGRSLTI